jgi:hypothetical protein
VIFRLPSAAAGLLRPAAVVALFVLLLGAAPAAAGRQPERVAVGDSAIDFTMQSIDGETYTLSDLRGEKNAIVIFFRGTW